MANLYIYAGTVTHTYADLAELLNRSPKGICSFVSRWAQSIKDGWEDPAWFQRYKIDDKTTDYYIQKIRQKTFEAYAEMCEFESRPLEFDPPGGKVTWKYTPPRGLVPLEDWQPAGGCKYRLWLREREGQKYYYQTEGLNVWEPGDIVYQNCDPLRVNRVHRRLCNEAGLWHQWRTRGHFIINGVRFDSMTLAAAAAGVSYWKFRKIIVACRELKETWPEGWSEGWTNE